MTSLSDVKMQTWPPSAPVYPIIAKTCLTWGFDALYYIYFMIYHVMLLWPPYSAGRLTWLIHLDYLMGVYNAGPKSALFLRVALIKGGVTGAGVIRAILKREYHVFES